MNYKYGQKVKITSEGFYKDQEGFLIDSRLDGYYPSQKKDIILYKVKLPLSDVWFSELQIEPIQ